MKRVFNKFCNSLYIVLILLFVISANLFLMAVPVKADTLLIQNNGEIILVMDDNVLGVFIAENKPTPPPAKQEKTQSPSNPSTPATPVKAIPIVPPNTPSIVQTSPSPVSSNKLQVTIKSQTSPSTTNQIPTNASSPPVSNPSSIPSVTPKASSIAPNTTINRDVNKVIFEGATNQAVLTIKSNQNVQNAQIIQQGSTEVSTFLPLQIDTKTRAVSAILPNGTNKLNVLPQQAIEGVLTQGLINNPTLNQAILKVTLEDNQNQAVYKINGEKSGTLFGIFPVKSPVEVKLSTQTGTVVNIVESLPFRLFGSFIK